MAGFEPIYRDREPRGELAVVAVLPGPGTGDTTVVTHDGTHWRLVGQLPAERGTGDRHSHYYGDTVHEI